MPAAAPLPIAPDDQAELRRWARSAQLPAVLVQRARYTRRGLDGLPDHPRPGRPQTVRRLRRAEILSVTLNPPPPRLGITHWSTRLLARELGVSHDTVARVWREYGVRPWRAETFKFSHRPAAGRQGPRRRRPVPAPTRARGRAVRG